MLSAAVVLCRRSWRLESLVEFFLLNVFVVYSGGVVGSVQEDGFASVIVCSVVPVGGCCVILDHACSNGW